MTKSFSDICLERAEKAHQELCKICRSRQAITMSIPPQKFDSDMVIQASIDDTEELCRRLKRAIQLIRNIGLDWSAEICAVADELEAPLSQKEDK